jgi:hypothetical protein
MPVSALRLRQVRDRLLDLHKALLDAERARFEREHGRVASSGQWLQLVLSHEQFAWLRPYSGLIVRIDEWIASDAPAPDEGEALWQETDKLTTLGEARDESPEGLYGVLVDTVPAAAAQHAAVREALRSRPEL